MGEYVAECDDEVAIRNALEKLGVELAQLAQGVTSDFELALNRGLAVVVRQIGIE
jgi:hypothetical protein